MDTKELLKLLSDDDTFIKSENEPMPGDVFLFRGANHGHTGIVISYDKESGEVTTAEAKGKDDGVGTFTRDISRFSGKNWKGFFRPKNENSNKKNDANGRSNNKKDEKGAKNARKSNLTQKDIDALNEAADRAIKSSTEVIKASQELLKEEQN